MAERREKGMGTIYKIDENKWKATIELTSREDGKRKTKSFTGKSEAVVRKKLNDWRKEQTKFSAENIRNMTLSTYITNWLENYKKLSLKPESYRRLKNSVEIYVVPNIGHITMGELKTDDIQILINTISDQTVDTPLSFSSIKKVRDSINSCLQDGVNKGDFQFNVCAAVKLPSPDKRKPRKQIQIFTEEEKAKVIAESERVYKNGRSVYSYGAMFPLLLNTGIRMGEALCRVVLTRCGDYFINCVRQGKCAVSAIHTINRNHCRCFLKFNRAVATLDGNHCGENSGRLLVVFQVNDVFIM